MKRRRGRQSMNAINKIDMTPLIDLTFLLLIVFMITMPLLNYSIKVETPQMNADPMPREKTYNISLDKSGRIFYGKQSVSESELLELLTDLKRSIPDAVLLLHGDKTRAYGEVIKLQSIAKKAGFDRVSQVTGTEK